MSKMRFKIIFGFLFVSFSSVFSVEKNFLIKTYGVKEGLSHSIVTGVIQDQKGYIWVGTYSGLNRFDGHEFKTYNIKDNLVYDVVRAVVEESNETLWIGTEQGLSSYSKGKFINYTTKEGLVNDNVRSLIFDQNENLFIGTVDGLSIYKEGKFLNYTEKDHLRSDFISTIFVDSSNTAWVGTNKGIIVLVDYKIISSPFLSEFFNNMEIISINQDSDGTILISARGNGLFKVKGGRIEKLEKYESIYFGNSSDWMINKSKSGKLIFTSPKEGIYFPQKKEYHKFGADNNIYGATSAMIDREGSIWLTTFGTGLIKIHQQKISKITRKEGLVDSNIRYLFIDSKERLWLGNQSYITLLENSKFRFFQNANNTPINKVRKIIEDKNGIIWFGTAEGLMKYENGILSLEPITEKLSKKSIYTMTQFNSNLLIAVESGDLYEYNPLTQILKQIDFPDNSIGIIWYLQSDIFEKNIIIQGPNGILKYTPDSTEKFSKFVIKDEKLIRRYEKFLYFSDNNYILATDEKIIIQKDKTKKEIEIADYIPSAQITSMHLDSNNVLWIGSSRGVLRYENEQIILFDTDDGLAGNSCMFYSILESKSKIYFGTSEGVSIFDNDNFTLNTIIPRPVISRLIINNVSYDTQDQIELNYDQNNIQFYYSGLSFVRPDRSKYRFKLEGFDKDDWNPITNRNFTIYNNLSPGKYTFIVDGTNNDGLWSEKAGRIQIKIVPAFWQTIWFKLFLSFIGLSLGYFFYKLRVRQIEKKNLYLEQIVQERTKELVNEKEKSETLLLNILPNEIAQELKNNNISEPKQYQSVTVVFTDFVGFTGISERMTPKALVKELNQYFHIFDTVLEKHNIEKLKTIGDGYMAAGGIPTSNNTHPIDCILAFMEIQTFISDKNKRSANHQENWSIRIGMHTGTLIAGVIGKKKFTYDVWGDTVNTASRLESSGAPNKINISAQMYEKVKDFFVCEERGKVIAKGKGSLDMYFIEGIKPELSINGLGLEPNEEFYLRYEDLKKAN